MEFYRYTEPTLQAIMSQKQENGDTPSNESSPIAGGSTDGPLLTTSAPGVQIQVLQQGGDSLALQSLIGSDLATSQIAAFANLSANRQQEVIAACQQQLLQSLRTNLPPGVGQPIVVPSGVQNVTVVTSNTSSQSNKIPTHYVPYNTDPSHIITQPVTSVSGLSAHTIATTGYDHHGLYTPQIVTSISEQQNLSTRTCPQTINWLLSNYETAEGVSLPRSTLYNHYLRHCAAKKIDAVNAASFGKLIRSVFIGLKTRRLGTRGNSKYHYYGIRIKPDSPLNTYPQDDGPTVAMRQPSTSDKDRHSVDSANSDGSNDTSTPQQQHQQYLGEHRPELDPFPEIDWDVPLSDGITSEDVLEFVTLYREHCEAILDVVANLQFQMVENLWQLFWTDTSHSSDIQDDEHDHKMPQEKLILLTSSQPILDYLVTCDHILYQCIINFLIPNVLKPIPATLTQAVRNFAKSLESWMKGCLDSYMANCVESKVAAVVAFSQTLRRYTSLNHLAQAARAVLQNSSQINQMINDLNRVDFANVQEQASWVCQCDETLASRLEHDFKSTLRQQNSLEQWAVWLENVVDTVLQQYEGTSEYSSAARQFLLKWSFYSSMVIRDLTLRSAASFGSFHLIRLLYDEYMFYLIEHKVARVSGRTPIAIMTEFSALAKAGFNGTLPTKSTSSISTVDSVDSDLELPAKRQRL